MVDLADGESVPAFQELFIGKFSSNKDGVLETRQQSERKASKTAKQRASRAIRTVQINFRASLETKELLRKISQDRECSEADVMEMALKLLAKKKRRPNAT